jgi:O-acetyl-ADP-ribose deacetylase (regulator of RNase III)
MSNTKDVFEYGAFEKFLELFSKCVPDYTQGPYRKVSIGFPQIGAGLAGGDWSRISKMIEKFSEDVSDYADVTVVEYQP